MLNKKNALKLLALALALNAAQMDHFQHREPSSDKQSVKTVKEFQPADKVIPNLLQHRVDVKC